MMPPSPPVESSETEAPRSRRAGWASVARQPLVVGIFKGLVVAGVLASVGVALKGYRHSLEGRVEQLHFGWLAVAGGAALLYRVVNAYGWVLVLRSLGAKMPATTGVRIWLVSETLRWLPGSVWSLFSRVVRAKAAGVPPVTASISLPLELFLAIASWTIAACVGVGLSGAAATWLSRLPAFWIAVVAGGLALAVCAAFVTARLIPSSKISRKLHGLESSLEALRASRPNVSLLVGTTVFLTALCFLNGAAFLAVLRATCDSPPGWLAVVGINAIGWLVGFFAFFAPAGLGVREGGMAAMLSPLMPVDAALVGVLVWRLIQILVELLCLAGCFLPAALSALRKLATRSWAATG
jgi:hypothetical protein